MSVTIAIVLNVTGQAWAEAPDGSRRLLEAGDGLLAGETLVTADDAKVLLDFGYENTAVVDGGISLLATSEMAPNFTPAADDTSVSDDSVASALASIEEALGGSIDEAEAPAAGIEGGSAGGSSSVRLARIIEEIAPSDLNAEFSSVGPQNQLENNEGTAGEVESADPLPGTIIIDSVAQSSGVAPTFTATGSTFNLAPGSSVQVTLTDQDGNTLVQTVAPGAGGQFTAVFSGFTGIVDGPVSVTVSATGADGITVSDSVDSTLDVTDGAITVNIDAIDNGAETLSLSGSATDVAAGETVAITITDTDGTEVTTTATVGADGSYSVTGVDISSLIDGPLTIDVSATDRNGNEISDSQTGTLDATAGNLTVAIDTVDNTGETVDLSGMTSDVAAGETVSIIVTDANGTEVATTATVAADGSYAVTGIDVSGLVDGSLTVDVAAEDRNGNAISDSQTGTLDATAGNLTVAIDNVDNTGETVDLSGTTSDVAAGETVAITVTDANGTEVATTAIVGADGTYAVTGVDVSSLLDGSLTVDASATDRSGNALSDSATGTLDATASNLSVAIDGIDNATQTVDLSGSTTDVAAGETVAITVTDTTGTTVATTAAVGADGSYAVTGVDVSGLVDGALTVDASATDRNGNEISDSQTGTLDATAGNLTIAINNVDSTNELIDLSGTSSDVAPGQIVNITVTDTDGTDVTTTATVGADGSYAVTGLDVSALVDGSLTIDVLATDRNGNALSDSASGDLDATASNLSVSIDSIDNTNETVDLSGSTTDVGPGETVSITVTDADGTEVTTTATVGADGSYAVTGVDLSGLVDGALTVDASATDRNGNSLSDSATGTLDATAGNLTVAIDNVDNTGETIDLSGTSSDVAPGQVVNITVTDTNGATVATTASVGVDGSYAVTGVDVSSLVDGSLTVDVSAEDRNGNSLSDSATATLDATAGNLTVAIDTIDNTNETADLSGSTTDVAPGQIVNITVTDTDGTDVTTTATVGADGSYAVAGVDVSGLVDGSLTINVSATDRNGNSLSDSATGTLDATAGNLTVAIDTVDNTNETVDLSGSANDVAPGETVAITVTDANGTEIATTASVGADGSYAVDGVDVSGLVDGPLTVDASATDRNGNALSDSATGTLDATAGNLTVAIDNVDNAGETIDLSGTSSDVAPGQTVNITVTDADGTEVATTATVGADGSYSITDIDVSTLVDGSLTVDVAAEDRNGNALSDSATGTLDATAGNLTVAIDNVDNTGETVDLSGTTSDVAPGETVAITVTDAEGTEVTTTAPVGAGGSYAVTGVDLSGLVDGALTIDASATDRNGNALSDSAAGTLDATTGNLTVAIDNVDNTGETIDLSGTSSDVAPGQTVNITVTDADGTEVTTTATVGADGSYSITDIDVSTLVDGSLTVNASATDRNGNSLSDSAIGTLDATAGNLTVAIDNVDNTNETVDLSGSTTDVAPGETVSVTVTDANGTEVATTATVGADGSYAVTGIDVSGLVDGSLTIRVSAADRNGNSLSDSSTATLDATASNLSVAIDSIDNGGTALDLSGSTTDVAPGETVAITVTDANGTEVATTAIVGADGSYAVTGVDLSGLVDGSLTVDVAAEDRNGNALSDSATGTLDATAGNLTVAIDNVDNTSETVDLSGSTTDVAPGEAVTITITDANGTEVTTTATVSADGSYAVNGVDVSGLVDGSLTVDVAAKDRNGNSLSDSATGALDATTGNLTVAIDNVDNTNETVDLSGTTSDVAAGETVAITVTDANGTEVATTATVASDGSYAVTGVDISGLVDGSLTIDASATDRNGNAVSDSETGTLDATVGGLTVSVDNVNDTGGTLDLSGSTTDVAPGETVAITVTDANGTEVATTAIVGADGSYAVNGVDVSGLVDGSLTVDASATDRNGNAVSDSETGTIDATAGNLTVAIDTVDSTNELIDLSGTSSDVAPGQTVNITVTDADGTEVTTTATIGADGSYAVTGLDISALVDGSLTIDVSATDRNGNALSDSASGDLDATASNLSVSIDSIDNTNEIVDLSGSTTDVAPGETVAITVTDANGAEVATTAIVGADGTYSGTGVDLSSLVDGTLTIDVSATDRNGNALSDSATGDLDATAGNLTVAIDNVDNTGETIDLSGTSSDVAPGQTVDVTVTDANGTEVTTTATVGADGSYSVTDIDVSTLVDGSLTVNASATDRNGNALSDSATGTLDATAGNLTVAIDNVDNSGETIDLSGTSSDVAPGQTVNITVTDANGTEVTTTATIGADGSYAVTGVDVSALVDGSLTIDVSATDRNGNAISDSETGTLDATAGNLSVAIDNVDNTGETIDLSGTSSDVAPGETVAITVSDTNGATVVATAAVDADGSFAVTGVDLSGLVDGALTVDASATDRNGNSLSDSATGTLDATTGNLTVAIDTVDNTNETVDLSGSTTDVAPGETVNITITDVDGTEVATTASVGADGSYAVTGVDVSGLVDGSLTVDVSAEDRNGNALSDSATGTLDATASNLSVAIDSIDNTNETVDLSGSTTDVAPGETVTITITDANGTEVATTASVGADGSYAVTGVDVSSLVDGSLTVDVSAEDRNGNSLSDSATATLDATAGNLSVSIDSIDNTNETVDLSGSTTDVAPGETVAITVTDAAGTDVTTTATVGADGSYAVTGVDVSGLVDGSLTVDVATEDRNGNSLSDSATGTLDATASNLSVAIDSIDNTNETVDLSGSTTDVAPGETVSITISDADGTEVTTTATVGADGSYAVTGVDVSGLVDGSLTVDASATDRNGNSLSDSATGTLDATAGNLTVAIDTIDNTNETVDLSGSTTDVAPGETVSVTIADADGTEVTTTATVGADGSYAVTGADVSGLVDGPLTVDASAIDRNGNALSDSATGTLDATAGNLTVAIDNVDNAGETIDLSGTSSDVAPGQTVNITVTDADGTEVATTATVGADGSYSITDIDVSTLVDGSLTVDVAAEDRNGNALSDSATGTLDATAGNLTVAIDNVDNTSVSIDLSGSTSDVASGQTVDITVSDVDGTEIDTTATVGADGSYAVSGLDISGLADGALTITASATDRNGNTVSDVESGNLDVNDSPEAQNDSYTSLPIEGLFGQYYAYQQGTDGSNLTNLAQVENFVNANNPDATFVGTNVAYGPISGGLGSDGKIQSFLGSDSASLSTDPDNSSDAIIRMTGELELAPGTYQFRVRGDDGYRIEVNGATVAIADRNQSATTRIGSEFTLTGEGPHTVEIIYWDQAGRAELDIDIRPAGGTFEVFGSDHVSHTGQNPALMVDENQSLDIAPGTLLANDTDADGDTLIIQSVQNATNGTVSIDGAGNVVFTPDSGYTGEASFTYTVSDGEGGIDTATATINVLPAASIPSLTAADATSVTAGDTVISTGNEDVNVNPSLFNSGNGLTQALLEQELGVAAGYLDNRFDPTGPNVDDPGTVNVSDGKITGATQALSAGMTVEWDYQFTNGEDDAGEVSSGYNDLVVLVVTAPSGAREALQVDSSENKFPDQVANGSFGYTATESGIYQFQWVVLNGLDSNKDSSLALSSPSYTVPGLAGTYGAPVMLDVNAALVDQDGSETLELVISGVPSNAALSEGSRNADNTWSLTPEELDGVFLLPPEGFSGNLDLSVTATATETANEDQAFATENFTVTVAQTDETVSGNANDNTLTGGATNDLVRGYAGNDILDGNAGDDVLQGGIGNDTLIGGAGNDVLTGGFGADVFRWELGDESDTSAPQDVVTDFTIDATAGFTGSGEGDQLALDDLLQDATPETATDFLMAKEENGDTVLYLNKDGALADNADNAQQSIVLSGVSMDGQTSDQFIDTLVNSGHIKIE